MYAGPTRWSAWHSRIAAVPAAALLALTLGACSGSADRTVQGITPGQARVLDAPGSSPGQLLAGDPGPSLAWPPAEAQQRMASDDYYPFEGTDYASKGGDTTDAAPSLLYSGTERLNWAIYSLGGFGADIQLESIDVMFSLAPDPPPGTAFYFGLSNYAAGRWDWFSGVPTDVHLAPANPGDYVSPGGSSHVAVVLDGSGSGQVDGVVFNRIGAGAKPEPPQNLTGSATWFSCDLSWDPVVGASGYHVYRSSQPDMSGATRRTSAPVLVPAYSDPATPETTFYYAVRSIRGTQSEYSNIVELTTGTLDLQPPTNLDASAIIGKVTLTWTEAAGAAGYNVFRASKPDMSNEVNIGVATGSMYEDLNPQPAQVNYYRLSSRYSVFESGPSETASVFVPEASLPAPTNLRIVSQVGDECTVAWDWPLPASPPTAFRVYVRNQADFKIEFPYHENPPGEVPGDKLSYRIQNLPPGSTRWCRVCALDENNKRGQMTDALQIDTGTYWTMNQAEAIGTGTGPISALVESGDLTAAYVFDTEVGKVRLARRNAGTWASEAIDLETHMGAYVDMAHDPVGGNYMVFTQEIDTGDLWGSEGVPAGSWNAVRINGDGSTAIGASLSGFDICCAATSSHFVVAHSEISYVGNESFRKILYHKRSFAGGSWSLETIRNVDEVPLSQSMLWDGSDVYILNKQPVDNLLYFGSEGADFNWVDINPTPTNGSWNEITQLGSFFYSPTVDTSTGDVGVIDNTAGSWNLTTVDGGHGFIARTSMAADEDMLFMTYLANSPVSWYLAVLEGGSWTVQKLRIPTGSPGQYLDMGDNLTVAAMDAVPYFVFDSPDGNLYCASGIPPA